MVRYLLILNGKAEQAGFISHVKKEKEKKKKKKKKKGKKGSSPFRFPTPGYKS